MASPLERLPTEIVEMIANFCVEEPVNRLYNLRATCRTIEADTYDRWRSSFFTDRYVDLTPAKLTELKDIAAIPGFALSVEGIIVRCEGDAKLFRQNDQRVLRSSELNQLWSLMAAAFQNLQNLQLIQFEPAKPEPRDHAITDSTWQTIDVSKTFSFVLSAAQYCGLRPTVISSAVKDEGMNLGISDISFMPHLSELFSEVERLDLQRLSAPRSQNNSAKFPEQVARSLNLMRSLTRLRLLDMSPEPLMRHMSMHAYLPSLTSFCLDYAECLIRDVILFLRRHANTLIEFEIRNVTPIEDDAESIYRVLLENLRDSLHLSNLAVGDLYTSDGSRCQFLKVDQTDVEEDENEDGFVEVDFSDIVFEGEHSVQEGLSDMLSWMILTPHPNSADWEEEDED